MRDDWSICEYQLSYSAQEYQGVPILFIVTFFMENENIVNKEENRIDNVILLREGKFNGSTFSASRLKRIYDKYMNDQEDTGYKPTIFIDHHDFKPNEEDKGAVGIIENLKFEEGKIFASLKGTTDGFLDLFKRYPYSSVELANNELIGLALLGSLPPAVKRQPIMLSKNLSVFINHNHNFMDNFTKLLEEVKQKEKITLSDMDKLNGAILMLSDEDQKLAKEDMADIKVFKEESTPTTNDPSTPSDPKEDGDDGDDDGPQEDARLARERDVEFKKLEREVTVMKLSKSFEEKFVLSKDRNIGFGVLPEDSEEVVNFLSCFSADDQAEFLKIVKLFKTVDFSTTGHSDTKETFNNECEETRIEILSKAREMHKKEPNLSVQDHLNAIYATKGI